MPKANTLLNIRLGRHKLAGTTAFVTGIIALQNAMVGHGDDEDCLVGSCELLNAISRYYARESSAESLWTEHGDCEVLNYLRRTKSRNE